MRKNWDKDHREQGETQKTARGRSKRRMRKAKTKGQRKEGAPHEATPQTKRNAKMPRKAEGASIPEEERRKYNGEKEAERKPQGQTSSGVQKMKDQHPETRGGIDKRKRTTKA